MTLYFHARAAAVSEEDVRQALIEIGDKYPNAVEDNLSPNGWGNEGRPIDLLANDPTAVEQVRHCVDFLIHYDAPATQLRKINPAQSAYGLKHIVERWRRTVKGFECGDADERGNTYVCTMAFIVACWLLEIPASNDPTPFYPIAQKVIDTATGVIQLRNVSITHRTIAADKNLHDIIARAFDNPFCPPLNGITLEKEFPTWRKADANQRARVFDRLLQTYGITRDYPKDDEPPRPFEVVRYKEERHPEQRIKRPRPTL